MNACEDCTKKRLLMASAARILAGTGLTYSNAEEFKEVDCPHTAPNLTGGNK